MSASTNITGYLAAGPVASTPTTANPPAGGLSLYFADDTKVLLAWNGTTYVEQALSPLLDVLGNTQGDIIYRGPSGWVVLGPGTTGQVLQSGGASADPSWITLSGSGTVTSIVAGTGLAGGTITSAGTISLAAIGAGELLGNGGTASAAPSGVTLSDLLALNSNTLTLAGQALHEKLVFSIPGTLSASTIYGIIPIADTIVVPASWSAPSSEAVAMTNATSVATTLDINYVASGTTSVIGTVVFGTTSVVLNGPTADFTLSPGAFVFAATGTAADTTLANVAFTMVALKQ